MQGKLSCRRAQMRDGDEKQTSLTLLSRERQEIMSEIISQYSLGAPLPKFVFS